jgi:hypothetical protein
MIIQQIIQSCQNININSETTLSCHSKCGISRVWGPHISAPVHRTLRCDDKELQSHCQLQYSLYHNEEDNNCKFTIILLNKGHFLRHFWGAN